MAQANKVVPITHLTPSIKTFDDLIEGDSFQPVYANGPNYPVYTKIRPGIARCHSVATLKLEGEGSGQHLDPIVKVDKNEKVVFVPVVVAAV